MLCQRNIRLKCTHYFISKQQQIACNHSSDIEFRDFTKKGTAKPYSFLVTDSTLASDNPSRFRKNLLERI